MNKRHAALLAAAGALLAPQASAKWDTGKRALTRPAVDAPDPDVRGFLEIRSKKKDGRQRFDVRVQHYDGLTLSLYIEDAVDSAVFVEVGLLEPSTDGDLQLRLDTQQGDAMPLGVLDVAELIGRAAQVRDGTSIVYLEGKIPDFHKGKPQAKAKETFASDGGKAKLRLRSHAKSPDERFDLKGQVAAPGSDIDIFVASPEDGTLTFVGCVPADPEGLFHFRLTTHHGDPLPFGVAGVEELAGLAFEVRQTGSAEALLSGEVPAVK